MKNVIRTIACSLPLAMACTVYAQTGAPPASPTTPAASGTPAAEGDAAPPRAGAASSPTKPAQATEGWSVRHKVLGTAVYNGKGQKIGDIDDVILAQNGKATDFVVGAGGFLGLGEHDVAIPYEKIVRNGDELLLKGYTEEQLKAMPAAEKTK